MESKMQQKRERIYVCHTYYHVYVTCLKELNLPKERQKKATLILSKMSTDFKDLKQRMEKTGLFEEVLEFDEKREEFFPQLERYKKNRGKILNLFSRIRLTSKLAKLEEAYIPTDFKKYKDIYVFCDADPIGCYLNKKRIWYHAIEDGLNCLKYDDAARYDNRGQFRLKAFLSSKLNLIFIQNGYGKYCKDMEVNDISVIFYPCKKYIEVPRQPLVDHLSAADKEIIVKAFVRNIDLLQKQALEYGNLKNKILILTEPLCTLDVREQIFRDIILRYEKEGIVFLKPHPRDLLDYQKAFPNIIQFDADIPMEIFNFFSDLHFTKVVGVFTEMKGIHFADETVRLGPDFMDQYEDPKIHRQNEFI